MKQLVPFVVAISMITTPLAAQDEQEGNTLMEQGIELFLEGLREEMSPAMENMQELLSEFGPALLSFMEEMGPAFGEVLEQVKDWAAYQPPEILPNGDIIMRKKADPEPTPDDPPPVGSTDI